MLIRPLTPFGAQVDGVDLRLEPEPGLRQKLKDAWDEHALLLFRDQELTREQLLAVAGIFGRVSDQGLAPGGSHFVSNVTEPGTFDDKGEMTTRGGDGELKFHFDHAFERSPLKGLMLYGIEVPPKGGDTLFADVRGAYALLPAAVRDRIAGLTIRHTATHLPGSPTADHPLVWEHPATGKPIFYFSQYHAVAIPELAPGESEALIKEFPGFIDRPEVTYRHRWQRHDLVVWDNLALQHARENFDPQYRRHLRRVQIGF